MLSLPVLQPLQAEWERILSLKGFLESKFTLDAQYAQTLKSHLKAAQLQSWPETSHLRPAVDALLSSISQEINHRLESNNILQASLFAGLNALRREMLDQDRQFGTLYDALLQASDMKKAKGSVERELILLKNPGPGSPKETRTEKGFFHRRARSKEETRTNIETADMRLYLDADMRLRHVTTALITERADFRASMPQAIDSLAAKYQGALEQVRIMLKRYAEAQLDFAGTTNKQASTLLLKVQDVCPYRDTLHLQQQMKAKEQTLFDEVAYFSLAFPMLHQNSQPVVFGMRLQDRDKTSVEAVAVFRSLIARGVDWAHFGRCMVLPSQCRNYRTAKNANELEQGWALGPLWRDSFITRLNAQESAQLLLLYLDFLVDPLLLINEEVAGTIQSQDLSIPEKVARLVRKWRGTPQGDLASAIFACWWPFRYDSAGLPNLRRDWPLLAGTLTRSKDIIQQKLFLILVECFGDTEGGDGPPLHTGQS